MTFAGETGGTDIPLAQALGGALAWWRDAGVDLEFADAPQSWLAEPKPGVAESRAEQPAPVRHQPVLPALPPAARLVPAEGLPGDLAAFTAWWLNEAAFTDGAPAGRIAPRGQAGAPLMVLVDEPEAADGADLLSGPHGKLLDAILLAMGTTRDAIYLASALPRHTPAADWDSLARAGLGEVLSHHLRLVAPQRLLVLGGNASSLLDHGTANSGQTLRVFYHEEPRIPAMAAPGLDTLAARPLRKAAFWQAFLDWTGTDAT